MNVGEFIESLPRRPLSADPATNLKGLVKIGGEFHNDCGIPEYSLHGQIVFESGHQPNFIPHAGVWRKVFLLDRIAKKVSGSVAVFGFADYNLSTASLLHQSKIPDHSRDGYRKIGFTIKEEDRWRRFNVVPTPGKAAFDAHMRDVYALYEQNAVKALTDSAHTMANVSKLTDILAECRSKAKSFADMNAYFFAKVCTEMFGLKVLFFRYTDVQTGRLFLQSATRLATKSEQFALACNESVRKRGLVEELGSAEEHFFPFWYHCRCGGKVTLSLREGQVQGRCPVCDSSYCFSLSEFDKYYAHVAPTAIARNLVFSEGLGTTLFVSGAGGGLKYGAVANDVSNALGFHKHTTLTWKGRDYYLGVAHKAALLALARTLGVSLEQLSKDDLSAISVSRRLELESQLKNTPESDKKTRQKYQGQQKNLETETRIASSLFSTTPSAFDIFSNIGLEKTLAAWESALASAKLEEGEFNTLKADVIYSSDAPSLYKNILTEK